MKLNFIEKREDVPKAERRARTEAIKKLADFVEAEGVTLHEIREQQVDATTWTFVMAVPFFWSHENNRRMAAVSYQVAGAVVEPFALFSDEDLTAHIERASRMLDGPDELDKDAKTYWVAQRSAVQAEQRRRAEERLS